MQYLPRKHEALSSNSSTTKTKPKKKNIKNKRNISVGQKFIKNIKKVN
jgi:hypothetical protein